MEEQLRGVEDLVISEVNVKEVEYVDDTSGVISKNVRPNFKLLGKKWGPKMKAVAAAIGAFTSDDIATFEQQGNITLKVDGEDALIEGDELEIFSDDVEGWLADSKGNLSVALDVTITDDLKEEVNRIQKLRKDNGFEVTDRIKVNLVTSDGIKQSILNYKDYICMEILATELNIVESIDDGEELDINNNIVIVNVLKTDEHGN